MRFTQKRKLLQILDSLTLLNKKLPLIQNKTQLTEVLSLCQETALEIGTAIEETDDYPQEIIACLEDYCESLYALTLHRFSSGVWKAQFKKSKNLLGQVKKLIANLQEEPAEVVFMPYKLSMWDSLQTVYEAAQKDERFHVSVVPLPYYTLTKERIICEDCYEGEAFAQSMPIIHYSQYDLAKEKPDIIFIHNPYDANNNLTQIYREFFSSELVKYTEHLVYIPYYVVWKYTEAIYAGTQPGAKHAWKTIVQSELLKKQYISDGISEQRVEAIGSPKFDMLIKDTLNPKNMPAEWKKLQNKKIFFLNTPLYPILNFPELTLNKLRTIMEYFSQRDDIALIWRPHPLVHESLETHNPGILESYEGLVEGFKESKNGIFDDTDNPNTALSIAHAYIGGDYSSIATLYAVTGKPMYLLSDDYSLISGKNQYVHAQCGEVLAGKIYMYSWEYNGLFLYDEAARTIQIQKEPFMNNYEQHSYGSAIVWKDWIYFIPSIPTMIFKYHTKTHQIIPIKDTEALFFQYTHGTFAQFNPVISDDCLYLLPVGFESKMYYLELLTDTVYAMDTDYDKFMPNLNPMYARQLFWGNTELDGCIFRACMTGPYIQMFSLESRHIAYIDIKELNEALSALTYDGAYFWFSMLRGSKVYQWDVKENKILRTITIPMEESDETEQVFQDIFYASGYLWLIPVKGYRIIRIDKASGEIKEINCEIPLQDTPYHLQGNIARGNYRIYHGCIYIFPYEADGIIKIHCEDSQIEFLSTYVETEEFRSKMLTDNIVNEHMMGLDEFVDFSLQYEVESRNLEEQLCGDKIWQYIADNL